MKKLEDKYEHFLMEKFRKSFQEIMDSSEEEQEAIDKELWNYLENDDKDLESSVLANHIIINWGKYDNER